MSKKIHRGWKRRFSLQKGMTRFMASALMMLPVMWPCPALAGDAELSEEHFMHLDPSAIKKVGVTNYRLLIKYFRDAERAIESENLEELMALYSERYSNRDQDKKFAEGVWRKIFTDFDDVSARHSMELLTYDETTGKPVVVLECSGLIQGTPKGGGRPVTIDTWDEQWHVLVDEGGWRLYGNSGESKRRFGSGDRKTHPLF